MRAGLAEAQRDPDSAEGWKLFLLVPRTLLHRRRGETQIPRAELEKRAALLAAGHCPFGRGSGGSVRTGRGTRQRNAASDQEEAQRRAELATARSESGPDVVSETGPARRREQSLRRRKFTHRANISILPPHADACLLAGFFSYVSES